MDHSRNRPRFITRKSRGREKNAALERFARSRLPERLGDRIRHTAHAQGSFSPGDSHKHLYILDRRLGAQPRSTFDIDLEAWRFVPLGLLVLPPLAGSPGR